MRSARLVAASVLSASVVVGVWSLIFDGERLPAERVAQVIEVPPPEPKTARSAPAAPDSAPTVVVESSTTPTATVAPTVTIRGRVEDTAGDPVAGALVVPMRRLTASGLQALEPQASAELSRSTNEMGAFEVPLADDVWQLEARAEGYFNGSSSWQPAGASEVTIILLRGVTLRGVVLSGIDGQPVEGVRLAVGDPARQHLRLHAQVRTDHAGRFEGTLAPGRHRLAVVDGEWVSVDESDFIGVDGVAHLEQLVVRVRRAALVRGRVCAAEGGAGIPFAEITFDSGASPLDRQSATTDLEGHYEAWIPPGSWEVWCQGSPDYPPPRQLSPVGIVTELDEVHSGVDFVLETGGAISGRVVDQVGRLIPGASVWASPVGARFREDVESDERGEFTLSGFARGTRIRLCAEHDGWVQPEALEVVASGADHVEVVLVPEAVISGTVVGVDGVPLGHVLVEARLQTAPSATQCMAGVVEADAEGVFRCDRLPPGGYKFRLRGMDGVSYVSFRGSAVELRAGEIREGVKLVWDGNAHCSFRGRVIDAEAAAVAGANVIVLSADEYAYLGSVTTDESGNFEIGSLNVDRANLLVTHDQSCAELRSDVVVDGEYLEITLRPPALIEGEVVDAATRLPIEEFELSVEPDVAELRSAWWLSKTRSATRTDSTSGAFAAPILAEVPQTLVVRAPGRAPVRYRLADVRAGTTLRNVVIAVGSGRTHLDLGTSPAQSLDDCTYAPTGESPAEED